MVNSRTEYQIIRGQVGVKWRVDTEYNIILVCLKLSVWAEDAIQTWFEGENIVKTCAAAKLCEVAVYFLPAKWSHVTMTASSAPFPRQI